MGMNLRFGSAVATLAMALTLGHSTLALADGEMSLVQGSDFAGTENSQALETDDIYAELSPTARPGGPGGPPPGGGWGPPPGGGGWGPPPGGGGWGPPPGGGGGGWGHGPRGVQCRAVNRRGIVFYGQGRNMPEARDSAMWNCQRVSRQCWMDGCSPM